MILKIIILVLILIVLALLVFFLTTVYSPAVKEQTKIDSNMFFAEHQYIFYKLKSTEKNLPVKEKAVVLCSCEKEFSKKSALKKTWGQTCNLINSVYGSINDCKFSCIGLGDCLKVCPQQAIEIKNETAVINSLCNGCGKCIEVCPKNVIKLLPISQGDYLECNNSSEELTSCDKIKNSKKKSWQAPKGFKIWQSCYRMFYKK